MSGVWVDGFPKMDFADGATLRKARLEINTHTDHCWWADPGWCSIFFEAEANGTDVLLLMDSLYFFCFISGILLITWKGLSELYSVAQVTLLSWDTDGDGVVELHEVVGALKIIARMVWFRIRYCRADKRGFDGRKIEWQAAVYGILDCIAKVDALIWTTVFFLMLYPRAFRNVIFQPCWECDDLEAVIAQQLGQVLGLSMETPQSTNYEGFFFSTDREIGYNCSEPLRGITKENNPTAASLMMQETRRATPRLVCPTDDDADGLRYLYPECEQLMACEEFVNSSGCTTYTGAYNCKDAYNCQGGEEEEESDSDDNAEETSAANDTDTNATAEMFSSRPKEWNRPILPMSCTNLGEYDGTAWFRTSLLAVQILLLQVILVLGLKMVSKLLLLLPQLKETRKQAVKLQGIAKLRKAEVRRMGDKGQQFVVKQAAKKTDGVSAEDAMAMLKKITAGEPTDGSEAKGFKGLAKRAQAKDGKMTATSLLMKGVQAAQASREQEAAIKISEAEAANAPADAPINKRLTFGEYMARADGPSGKPALKLGERSEPVSSMVAKGVAKRGQGGQVSPAAPTAPARLLPAPSFADDVKALTAAVHQRTQLQLKGPEAAGPQPPEKQTGSPMKRTVKITPG